MKALRFYRRISAHESGRPAEEVPMPMSPSDFPVLSDPAPEWIKVRSWHLLSERHDDRWRTLCGRTVPPGEVRSSFPGGARTCETCLRVKVKA